MMLAAIRKHRAVVIAIALVAVIVAPTYYFLMPRNTVILPVINANNARRCTTGLRISQTRR